MRFEFVGLIRRNIHIFFLAVLGLFFGTAKAQAQTAKPESLAKIDSLQKLADSTEGSRKIDLLNQITFLFFGIDNKRAEGIADEALQLSQKLNYEKGIGEALVYKGLYERIEGDAEKSAAYFKKGIATAHKVGDRGMEGYGLIQYSYLMTTLGKKDSALVLCNLSYNVLKDSADPTRLSMLYKAMGNLMGASYDQEARKKYLFRSLKIREALNDAVLLSDIYLVIAEYYTSQANYDEALTYINKAEKLIPRLDGEVESIYDINYQKATILFHQANYLEALKLYNDMKKKYNQYSSRQDYVNLLTNIGYLLSDLGSYELSLNNLYEGLKIANENNFVLEKAKILWLTGWVYNELNQLKLAKEFAYKSLEVAVPNGYKVEEATAYNLLGTIAEKNLVYDSALFYFNKSLTLREELKDPIRISSSLNNIGRVWEKQKKYSDALTYQLRSLKIEEEVGHRIGIAYSLQSIGQLYLMMGQLSQAKNYLDKAEKLAIEIKAKQALQEIYLSKSMWYEKQGLLKEGLEYYKKQDQLKDSLYDTSLTNRIASLQNEYTVLQKEREIEILSKDKELKDRELEVQQAQVRQQRFIIFFGGALILLIVGGLYYIYKNYKKVTELNRTIQENSEEIQAQAEELQQSNQTIAQINEGLEQTVEARTNELKQAYKELDTFFYRSSHDFRRPLTTFMGLSEVAKITVKDEAALGLFEKVNETARGLDKMLFKLQSISDAGSLQLIYKEIFIGEIIDSVTMSFQEELKSNDIRIVKEINAKSFFSYPALVKVIMENLIENSIMFSEVGKVIKVVAYSVEKGIAIEVIDQGFGIEEENINRVFDMYYRAHERSKGNGLGLYIVKRVIDKLRGTIELKSSVGSGTTVKVFLPNQPN